MFRVCVLNSRDPKSFGCFIVRSVFVLELQYVLYVFLPKDMCRGKSICFFECTWLQHVARHPKSCPFGLNSLLDFVMICYVYLIRCRFLFTSYQIFFAVFFFFFFLLLLLCCPSSIIWELHSSSPTAPCNLSSQVRREDREVRTNQRMGLRHRWSTPGLFWSECLGESDCWDMQVVYVCTR